MLLDKLVCPAWPITGVRDNIHGITEEAFGLTKFTLRHAQAAVLGLLSDRTLLVGHSLHKDLRSLRLRHPYVTASYVSWAMT